MDIVLIRAGATDYDAQGRIQGSLDIPLSQAGRAEVMALADAVRERKLQVLYAPQSQPAWESAELLAEAIDVRLKKVDALRNVNHGLWQGMRVEEIKQKHPRVFRQWQESPENICPPEGESLSEVYERVGALLDKLLKKHKAGAIGLVLSAPVNRVVKDYLKQGSAGNLGKPSGSEGPLEVIQMGHERPAAAQPR